MSLSTFPIVICSCCTRLTLKFSVGIIFIVFETGYCTQAHDRHQDIDERFSFQHNLPVAQKFQFRHDVTRSQTAFTALYSTMSSKAPRGKNLRSITQRNAGPGTTPLSPARLPRPCSFLVSQSDNARLGLFLRWKSTLTHRRDNKPSHILYGEDISMFKLRTVPLITDLLANWTDDRTLLNKILSFYRTSLCALFLRGIGNVFYIVHPLTTTSSVIAAPAHLLRLRLETTIYTRSPRLAQIPQSTHTSSHSSSHASQSTLSSQCCSPHTPRTPALTTLSTPTTADAASSQRPLAPASSRCAWGTDMPRFRP